MTKLAKQFFLFSSAPLQNIVSVIKTELSNLR
jgi:hypothetical protein